MLRRDTSPIRMAVMTAAICLTAASASSQSSTATNVAPPTVHCRTFPSSELAPLQGEWIGNGKLEMTGRPISSTLVVRLTSDGQALHLVEEDLPPNRSELDALWSVDCQSGEMVMFVAGNGGSGARLFRSRGFANGTVTFESDRSLRAWYALERFTFSIAEPGQLKLRYEMSKDGQVWRVGDVQAFARSKQ